MNRVINNQAVDAFHKDGYHIARGFYDNEEIDLLLRRCQSDNVLHEGASDRLDRDGRTSRLNLWNDARDDLYGMFSQGRRLVDSMEKILGDEVYHYHSKMMLKEPYVGGAWEWHQDYGYWYGNGCLYPRMASCMIAVDRATQANGCLQVLKGSHHCGRLEHGAAGDQTGADLERVEMLKERLELVYCELEPGDALFFHCNLLHCSAPNNSAHSRWTLICCYNAASNDPYKAGPHPNYKKLTKVDDNLIKTVGRRELAASA